MYLVNLVFDALEPPSEPVRLHLDLRGGDRQADVVEQLLGLGATHLDIGQHDVPWVVLGDPEGNPCCVMEERAAYVDTGPIAALPLDSARAEGAGQEPAAPRRPARGRGRPGRGRGRDHRARRPRAAPPRVRGAAVAFPRRRVRQRALRPSGVDMRTPGA